MTSEEEAKANEIYNAIIGKERNSLVDRYGNQAERVAKGRAIKQAQKLAEKKMDPSKDKLREMVKNALTVSEKKKSFPDLTGDGEVTKADILKGRGVIEALNQAIVLTDKDHKNLMKNGSVVKTIDGQTVVVSLENFQVDMEDTEDPRLDEDLDLGHEDDEPHMIKGELYRIGKYAMELYQMVDQFEGEGEVDFPAWWQSKITTAKNMVSSAKHYLEFELKEPEVDAMVGVAAAEDIIPNVPTDPLADELGEKKLTKPELKKREEIAKAMEKGDPKMDMEKKMAIATSIAKRVAEKLMDKK